MKNFVLNILLFFPQRVQSAKFYVQYLHIPNILRTFASKFLIMHIEQFREICMALPLTTEDMPFDDTLVAFRVHGKIFGCLLLDQPDMVVLKCDSERAIELRGTYSAIEGAYHWNKKYWNQIHLNGSVPDELIRELIEHAYQEVWKKLPKKLRLETT